MDKNQISAYIRENKTEKIKFAFADIDGVLRGKTISSKKFLDGLDDGYGFCDVVFGWDSADALYDNVAVTGWHTGFPDHPCRVDLSTFRTIPWQDNQAFFLADFSQPDGHDLDACPRSLLKKIARQCAEAGFHPEFAQEFEWFNFRETPLSLQEKQFKNLTPITSGMFGYSVLRTSLYYEYYNDLFNLLGKFNIPLEGLHTETGPGVYEAAIDHCGIVEAADRAVLLKTAVKEIAYKHGTVASFMAKWNDKLPGCSGHIHQSLWSKDQSKNLFYNTENKYDLSEIMEHYIAGQLYCLPHILPMYAPTTNSYKRLVEGAWAPTTVSWGFENRTTALRAIGSSPAYSRLETRVPGSDSNPYLAMAAALASGLYGIKHKLPLQSPPITGNAYADKTVSKLPANLQDATNIMKDSPIANNLFGESFVNHFTHTRLWECRQYSEDISNWELKRYFEII